MITINFEKAKQIKKNMLREERLPLLQQKDIEFQRALESGQDTSKIVEEKQKLRDVTLLVDDAKNLDEIKSISCLNVIK